MADVKTILCPIALEDQDREVLSWALDEAHHHDAKIILLHAAEPLNPTAQMLIRSLEDERVESRRAHVLNETEEIARNAMRHFCTDHMCLDLSGDTRIADIVVVRGRPEEVIVSQARALGADLIVMGAHAHSRIGEGLLGSVAQRVAQRAATAVLLVRIGR